MSNELSTIAHSLNDMQVMAESIARSGLFGMKTSDQALALMLIAQAENSHPATITQDYDIIQGRAARKTNSVLARFQKSGGRVEWHELTETKADATFSHPQGGSLRMTWTIQQAQKANLMGKDNWKNWPRSMLRARCIAEAVRAVYPAAIGGMLLTEEAQDLDASRQTLDHAEKTIDTATGEISAALPVYPAAKFEKSLPNWAASVAEGGKITDLLAMLQSKYTLSPEQLKKINALGKAPDQQPAEAMTAEEQEFADQL